MKPIIYNYEDKIICKIDGKIVSECTGEELDSDDKLRKRLQEAADDNKEIIIIVEKKLLNGKIPSGKNMSIDSIETYTYNEKK